MNHGKVIGLSDNAGRGLCSVWLIPIKCPACSCSFHTGARLALSKSIKLLVPNANESNLAAPFGREENSLSLSSIDSVAHRRKPRLKLISRNYFSSPVRWFYSVVLVFRVWVEIRHCWKRIFRCIPLCLGICGAAGIPEDANYRR